MLIYLSPLGTALVPYGLPCIRELFRFLISLTNPHDRHNSEVMIHMGLQLLTVALESAPIANYQSLLGLVKEELCRHLFQVSLAYGSAAYGTGESDINLHQRAYWNIVFWGLVGPSLHKSSPIVMGVLNCTGETARCKAGEVVVCRFLQGRERWSWFEFNCYHGITLCFDVFGSEVIWMLSNRENLWTIKLLIAQRLSRRLIFSQVPSPLRGSVDLTEQQSCSRISVTPDRRELSVFILSSKKWDQEVE